MGTDFDYDGTTGTLRDCCDKELGRHEAAYCGADLSEIGDCWIEYLEENKFMRKGGKYVKGRSRYCKIKISKNKKAAFFAEWQEKNLAKVRYKTKGSR